MGSPITLSGFNNIDFKAIVDIIMQAERQPVTRLQNDKKSEQTRLTAYGNMSSSLSSLKSAFDALETSSSYGTLTAFSSDETVLTSSATSSASRGTFTINVTSLARPQVTSSAERQFSDINATIIDGGTFSITQKGVTTAIDLTGVDTLAELRDAINNQQSGVKASIINDGSSADSPAKPFRLVLTSATPGVGNAFSINDQTSLGGGAAGTVLNLTTDAVNGVAKDTEFTYNGITIRSTSTTVTDAVPGLTLSLLKTGSATVTVSDDDSALKTKIKAAVSAFNSFNDFAQGQFKVASSDSTRPPLSIDPLLKTVNRQLRNYITADHPNSGAIANLSELGIRLTQTGKLEIDEASLDEALANNRSDVQAFFYGASGLATTLSDFIESYTQSGGSIDTVESRIQKTIDHYDSRISVLESQLVLREQTLNEQFTAADRAISQLNSQVSALSGLSNQFRLF